jgi:hypothetical protein
MTIFGGSVQHETTNNVQASHRASAALENL